MLEVFYQNSRFLVFLRRSLFFSQSVFLCNVFGHNLVDFFFLYVFKVLSMFGLASLRCKKL